MSSSVTVRISAPLIERILLCPGRWHLPIHAIERVVRKFGWQFCFETSVGIKSFGRNFSSNHFDSYVRSSCSLIETGLGFKGFLINPDLLIDEHTLTGIPITQSPHIELVRVLESGGNAMETEYVHRTGCGLLDLRRGAPVKKSQLWVYHQKRQADLQTIAPWEIKVLPAENLWGSSAYIIVDGKHRLAMAAVYDRADKIHLSILDPAAYRVPSFVPLYELARTNPSRFQRNLSVLEYIYGAD